MKTIDAHFANLVNGGLYLGRNMSGRDWFDMLNPKSVTFRLENWNPFPALVAKVEHPTSFMSWRIVFDPATGRYFSCYWMRRRWNISRVSFLFSEIVSSMVEY